MLDPIRHLVVVLVWEKERRGGDSIKLELAKVISSYHHHLLSNCVCCARWRVIVRILTCLCQYLVIDRQDERLANVFICLSSGVISCMCSVCCRQSVQLQRLAGSGVTWACVVWRHNCPQLMVTCWLPNWPRSVSGVHVRVHISVWLSERVQL